MKNNKLVISTVLFLVVAIWGVGTVLKGNISFDVGVQEGDLENSSQEGVILFYSDTCPHCAIVEKYIEDNNILDKISITQKEVSTNSSNSKELLEKAKACGFSTNSVGVPFLWTNGQCYMGDSQITDFLESEIK